MANEIYQTELANDRRTAAYLGVTVQLLRYWRGIGLGPPSLDIMGKPMYPIEQLKDWKARTPYHRTKRGFLKYEQGPGRVRQGI
jgi:hypothetical protein